jgi:hypothetical protein
MAVVWRPGGHCGADGETRKPILVDRRRPSGRRTSLFVRAGYVSLILPLIIAHVIGAVIGYRLGPGTSPYRLI